MVFHDAGYPANLLIDGFALLLCCLQQGVKTGKFIIEPTLVLLSIFQHKPANGAVGKRREEEDENKTQNKEDEEKSSSEKRKEESNEDGENLMKKLSTYYSLIFVLCFPYQQQGEFA